MAVCLCFVVTISLGSPLAVFAVFFGVLLFEALLLHLFAADSAWPWPDGSQERRQETTRDTREEMHGVWTWWNPSGELQGQKRYERGRIEEEKRSPPWWHYP